MDDLFTLKYGIGGLCVVLTLSLFFRVFEFVWALKKKEAQASEKATVANTEAVRGLTVAVQLLEHRLQSLEAARGEIPKLKNDLRRSFSALKTLAGDRWGAIRDDIMKDGFNA